MPEDPTPNLARRLEGRAMPSRSRCLLGAALLVPSFAGCQPPELDPATYFGQPPPGEVPVVFAPGTISKPGRYEQSLLYSPDGRTLTYVLTNSDWTAFTLYSMELQNGRWSEPAEAPFMEDDPTRCQALRSPRERVTLTSRRQPGIVRG